jgi:hypothetical protein
MNFCSGSSVSISGDTCIQMTPHIIKSILSRLPLNQLPIKCLQKCSAFRYTRTTLDQIEKGRRMVHKMPANIDFASPYRADAQKRTVQHCGASRGRSSGWDLSGKPLSVTNNSRSSQSVCDL